LVNAVACRYGNEFFTVLEAARNTAGAMTIDAITLQDFSFFKGNRNIFSLINRCTTQAGAQVLRRHITRPPDRFEDVQEYQSGVKFWMQHLDAWPEIISNGTLIMIEKFYETPEAGSFRPNTIAIAINSMVQKLFNKNEYSFIRFSVSHLIDFLKGCRLLTGLLDHDPPVRIRQELEYMYQTLELPLCASLLSCDQHTAQKDMLLFSYRARREMKHIVQQMMAAYACLDAMQSLARAAAEHRWVMPELLPSTALQYSCRQLCHPLLPKPVPYDMAFSEEHNFLFLTGANMSGKSTLLRSLGIGAVLAHIGMAVPAQEMTISFLEGIISNMQVEDDILKGESYFFAEVSRTKLTAEKLSESSYHLVLMDELFKGTNVHDAYECTNAVIEGLQTQKQNLLALSTHLYELADQLQSKPGMIFRYFHTAIDPGGHYHFTYQLKEGVSNDRIGFLVLKKEGILDLLQRK